MHRDAHTSSGLWLAQHALAPDSCPCQPSHTTNEMKTLSPADHKKRHVELHRMFDELIADFIAVTGKLPSQTALLELMEWSFKQTTEPHDNPKS